MEKWQLFDQNHWLTPLEKCQFSTFWNSCFYCLERCFFVLEYRWRHFLGLFCQKKKFEKWPFLDQNHGLTPLDQCQFFDFLNILFLYPIKGVFFFALQYRKRHFPGVYCLKKKVGIMAIFWLKPGGNPFGKMSIFPLFELLVFVA